VKTVKVPLDDLKALYQAVLCDHIDGDWIPFMASRICRDNLPKDVRKEMDEEYAREEREKNEAWEKAREEWKRGCPPP